MIRQRFPSLFMLLAAVTLLSFGAWQYFHPQVVIQWSTASELDSLGFFIFRAESEAGPFDDLINAELIPAQGQVMSGSDYQTVDRAVTPGTTYYYQLHEVQMDGSLQIYGPIEITAKRNGLIEIAAALILAILLVITLRKSRSAWI